MQSVIIPSIVRQIEQAGHITAHNINFFTMTHVSRSFLTVLFSVVFSLTSLAAPFAVKGIVTDSVGESEAFATFRIYSFPDSVKAVAVGTTDAEGVFSQSLDKAGKYRLVVNSVGKQPLEATFTLTSQQPVADLGTMVMSGSPAMLQEVTITAQRPLVVKEIDRIGYDVQADEDSKTNTVLEILRKVPMVSVESDGTIKVNGSSDFKVFKNGKPNKSFTSNAKDILAAIPASMIQKIEVITEPGAKYDAEGIGSILNIVTVENTAIRGVMGSASLRSSSQNDMIPSNGNLWLQSQIDKVTFSINGGGGYNKKGTTKSGTFSENIYPNGNVNRSESTADNKNHFGWFGGEASYELDTLNLFTADFNGFLFSNESWSEGSTAMFDAAGNKLYGYNSKMSFPDPVSNLDLNVNFSYQRSTRRKGENIIFNYQLSLNNSNNSSANDYTDVYQMPVDYTSQQYFSKERFNEHTFQLDWCRPFAKIHTLETGGKYVLRRNTAHNRQIFGSQPEIFSDFRHITDVGALYAQYSLKWKSLSFRAGLRYEYSRMKAEYLSGNNPDFASSFNDLVPSAAFSWNITQASSLAFNYASRINRPGIWSLNPVHNSTPTSDSYGNPDLSSARHNSFKLTFMHIRPKFNFNVSANFDMSNSGIVSYTFVDDNDIVNTTYANIGRQRNLSFNGFFQWSITPTTQWMVNGSARYSHLSQTGLKLSRWNWNAFTRLSQKLPNKFTIEAMMFHWSGWAGSVYSYSESSGISSFNYSIGLRKSFLKEDRLNINVSVQNPIGPNRIYNNSYTVNGDVTGWSSSYWQPRKSIQIGISYRFGSLNTYVKKTAKSISNDDLSSGGGNTQSGGGQDGGQGGSQGGM